MGEGLSVLVLHRCKDEGLCRSFESLTASDDRSKFPSDQLAIYDRAKDRLGKANTVVRIALDGVDRGCLGGEDGVDRSGGEAGRGGAAEVGSSQLSDFVGDRRRVIVRVERGRLENGASEEGSSRGGDEQSLDELGPGALSSERDTRGVSSERLNFGLDEVCDRRAASQL